MGKASNPEGRSIPPGGTRGKPARKRPSFSVVGGTRLPRWGKGINKKAKRLAGPVRVRPLEGSEFDA